MAERSDAPPLIDIQDKFQVNTIVWIRSLPEDELGPSRRMTEDIETLSRRGGPFGFEEVFVGSAAEMHNALTALVARCREGVRPILHFDCHGSEEKGVLLAPAGDHLSWTALAAALREVNVGAENNVCCIFGVCFGMYLSTALSITDPTPYFLTIAPERKIAVGELEERLPRFYERLFETGDITKAYREVLAPALSIFQCQEVFGKVLATYIVNHGSGAAVAARRENLVTKFFARRGISSPTPEQLRCVRGRIKAGLKLSQGTVDHYASTFLIGRQAGMGLEEIQRLAEVYRERRDARAR